MWVGTLCQIQGRSLLQCRIEVKHTETETYLPNILLVGLTAEQHGCRPDEGVVIQRAQECKVEQARSCVTLSVNAHKQVRCTTGALPPQHHLGLTLAACCLLLRVMVHVLGRVLSAYHLAG